ncbi:putative secologanin synthase [Helianthus annuus]|uniref:Putative cytochrome P450 n=1 Tax=Helianthus annuus TaxID=4232 RepID=A0A251V6I7_HELAN|nr:cytochrome P450 CYP72A219 [Helianthus annuus]KAF5814703.1 putative secologanin synthase [Helianthus annuus]KAJ0593275.1 putative secologanin synthase [Helianthus annuus]KAJ0601115.1 putative secologanin synthase [Helianthus annuus]KAJ0608284.1 putative secologanin synthase [Helianthus annuus]KAJ0768350.1 putative secologanin synthase [Helianthus annuus]
MEATAGKFVFTIVVAVIVSWGWKILNWVWLKPKKLEKLLREQGYKGNSYKLLKGDVIEFGRTMKEARSKSMPVSHDIISHVMPFEHYIFNKYGKKSYIWFGPSPRVYVMDPELIKEILSRPNDFQRPQKEPVRDSITGGLLLSEGPKWTKHRRIINPAFHLESIKGMFSNICLSCNEMVNKMELLVAENGVAEVDVWPYIDNLSGDVISRAAFNSNYEEAQKIFHIQKEQIDLVVQLLYTFYIPGGRLIPTKANKKFKQNRKELQVLAKDIVETRKKAIEMGADSNKDLLGILLASNSKEIKENGVGLSIEDVIEECKLFYIAGSETTSNLILWTMVCLSMHQEWQNKARQEITQVFGGGEPHFEGLKHLKIVTMILNEVLRLYPTVVKILRNTANETKLGNMMLPSGVNIIISIINVHHDPEIWGEDATEFKPERFSEGVGNATKGRGSVCFMPFGGGPKICIGQNLAMVEAKTAIAKILQRFSFELSPSYQHSPSAVFSLPPQFGAQLILQKI